MCGFLFVIGRTAIEKELTRFYELERQYRLAKAVK